MNLAIFSPHEDINSYTNRNIMFSVWAKKQSVNTTLYVSNYNYKTQEKKKLKIFFFEPDNFNGIKIYRIYSTGFSSNGISRLISYIVFSFLSLIVFFLIDKKNYDYVIGESVPPLCSLAAYLCSLKKKSNFVYQIRDPWPLSIVYYGLMKKNSLAFYIFEKINKFLISQSKFIISSLPYLKRHYRKRYNYKKKVYYLRNPADIDSFKMRPYPRIKKKIKVVFVGGFTPSFKMLNYFEALKILQKINKDFSFTHYFVGKGNDLKNCKLFVETNKLKDIYFLKSKTKQQVLRFISNCHLCIAIVSKNKNCAFGYNLNKVIDYSVSGRPIIFTNNLKKNCFIDDKNMGFNTSPSPIEIAKVLLKFRDSSYNLKKKMAKNARIFAEDELDIKKLNEKYCSIFQKN